MKRDFSLVLTFLFMYVPAFAGMVGIISSGVEVGPSTTVNNWIAIQAGRGTDWTATETNVWNIMPVGGTFSYLRVKCVDPGGAASRQFILRVNGSSSTVTCTVNSGSTSCSDIVHSVSVNAGDMVSFEDAPSGTPAASANLQWALKFTATNTNEYPVLMNWGTAALTAGATVFLQIQSNGPNSGGPVTDANNAIVPTGGSFTNLYATTTVSQVTDSVYTLRVNGIDTALTCTITGGTFSCNDTGHSVNVVAGDSVTYKVLTGSTGSRVAIGAKFSPTTDGESILLATQSAELQNSTQFRFPTDAQAWNATESNRQNLLIASTLRNLYVGSNPASGQTHAVTVSTNSVATALTCTVTGTAVSCNDTADQITVSDDGLLSIKGVTSATSGTCSERGGLVMFISQGGGATVVPQRTLTGIGL